MAKRLFDLLLSSIGLLLLAPLLLLIAALVKLDSPGPVMFRLGINWEVDLIQDFTNQIRLGFARVNQETEASLINGTVAKTKDNFTAPYLGAGLAFRLTNEIKLLSNADVVFKGRRSEYLLTIGAMAEF